MIFYISNQSIHQYFCLYMYQAPYNVKWPRVSVLLSLPGTHGPKTFLSISVSLTGLIVDLCEGCTARLVFFLDQHFSFQKTKAWNA